MKKRIVISVVSVIVVLAIITTTLIITNKYPDNYIYEFGGYNDHQDVVADMYEYDGSLYALVQSRVIISKGFLLESATYKHNLIVSVINENDTVVDEISFEEIEKSDSSTLQIVSYQYKNYLYIEVNTDRSTYMIQYNCLDKSYQINELSVLLDSFIVDEEMIYGYHMFDTPDKSTGNFYHDYKISYYELNMDMEVLYEQDLITLEHSEYISRPILSKQYLGIQGFMDHEYDVCNYTLYDIESHTLLNMNFEDCKSSELIVIDNTFYQVQYIFNEEEVYDVSVYDMGHNLITTFQVHEEQLRFVDENTPYALMYGEDLSKYNKVKLYNIFTKETVELEYDVNVYLYGLHSFGRSLYIVADLKETELDKVANGYNNHYIIHETVEDK